MDLAGDPTGRRTTKPFSRRGVTRAGGIIRCASIRRNPQSSSWTNGSNGEGVYKELLETLQRNTFTPIEWEDSPRITNFRRAPLATHKEVQVPPTVLEMYVGRYGEPVLVVTVRREGDHLSIEENGEPK